MTSKTKKKPAPKSKKGASKTAPAKARPVTKSRAIQIAVKACAPDRLRFECYGSKPANCRIYAAPEEPCWHLLSSVETAFNRMCLQPSRLVIVSRRTGKVIYNGSAHDEG